MFVLFRFLLLFSVSVSLFCCHFLWHLLLVSVASRRCLVFYVGWGRIFWRQHRIVAGSRHITIALTVRFVSHTQCVFTREAEGGYMARTCLMAQSNLSANKSHKNWVNISLSHRAGLEMPWDSGTIWQWARVETGFLMGKEWFEI